jgi:hypothetical protein
VQEGLEVPHANSFVLTGRRVGAVFETSRQLERSNRVGPKFDRSTLGNTPPDVFYVDAARFADYPAGWDQLTAVARKLKATGVTPLAIGDTREGNWIRGALSSDYPAIKYTARELPAGPANEGADRG